MYNKGNIIKEMYRYQLICGSKPSEFSHKFRSGQIWERKKKNLLLSVGQAWGKGVKRYKLGVIK